jgi:hypothetical protein
MTACHQPHRGIGNQATTSRRALLGAFAFAPVAAVSVIGDDAQPWIALRPPLPLVPADQPPILRRTPEGRSLSRFRYRNAENFFASIEKGIIGGGTDLLYQIGIVMQLGLSSYLLDVGFDDAWNARHLGLYVDRSLACANATGLGLDASEIERLAGFLSPYGKWRQADIRGGLVCPFSDAEQRALTRALLDQVRAITGHPRTPNRRRD